MHEERCPMAHEQIWHFGDYRLDLPQACLWHGTQALPGPPADLAGPGAPRAAAPLLVGYDAELARLHAGFATAQGGQRQVVLVTGEAGMGKTTLVDAFLAQLTATNTCWVAWGQCL